jgi:phage terminase small subunit
MHRNTNLPVAVDSAPAQTKCGEARLTAKQRRFVEEYLLDFNATQAAIRAGYSARSAANIGWENVRKREIADAIQARLDEFSMTSAEALVRLTEWARGTIEPFLERDEDGGLLLHICEDVPVEYAHLLKKVKQTKEVIEQDNGLPITRTKTEIELHDAKDAVVQIAKARGLLNPKRDLKGGGEPIAINVYAGPP